MENAMRTKKIALNVLSSIILHLVNTLASLVVRKIFIQYIGADVLGINSVYSNILSFLALSELGLGTTVAVCLYKPLAEQDYVSVSAYMGFLKKVYCIIGIVILGMGLAVMPFVPYIITTDKENAYIYISFFLYLCSVAFSYFFSYKKILLYADQKAYIYQIISIASKLVLNIGFAATIIAFRNYYIYLLVSLICTLGENFAVTIAADRQYKLANCKGRGLTKEEYRVIIDKLKGILCFSLGRWMVTSTDNIIISAFIGTIHVTFYTNYYLIINMLDAIFSNFASNISASMGNLIYTSRERFKSAFNKIIIIQHFLFSISTSGFIVLATEFVGGYFGEESVLDAPIVICMGIVYYINGFSNGLESVRKAFGLFEQDKFFNLFSPILNIIISVYGAKHWGIIGVLFGTIVCWIINKVIVLTWVLKKYVPEFSRGAYSAYLLGSIGVTSLLTYVEILICERINISSWFAEILIKGVVIVSMGILINILLLGRTKEFRELVNSFSNKRRRSAIGEFGDKMK